MNLLKTRKYTIHLIVFVFANLTLGSIAQAQVYFEETFLPVYILQNTAQDLNLGGSDSSSVPTESGFGYDLRTSVGYVFWNQVVLALNYQLYKTTVTRAAQGPYDSEDSVNSKSEWGITAGYLLSSWRFLATYIFNASRDFTSNRNDSTGAVSENTEETRTKGTGFQFTVGYSLALSSQFEIGPSLVYRSVTYARGSTTNHLNPALNLADKDFTTPAIDAGLTPMISVIARF